MVTASLVVPYLFALLGAGAGAPATADSRAPCPELAARSEGIVVVANKQDNTVSLLSSETGALLAELAVGVGPHEVAMSSDGRWAVVTNYGDRETRGSTLSVVDLGSRSVTRTIPLGEYSRPHGIAFLPGDERLAVTSETSQAVVLLDFATGEIEGVVETGQPASHMITVSPDGSRAYTANIVAGTVTELDLVGRTTGRTLAVAPMVEGIAISPDGRQLWVGSNQSHSIAVVDTDEWRVVDTIASAGMPYRIAITPDGRQAVVPSPMAGVIRVYDVANRREAAAIPAAAGVSESGPVGVAISADGRHAYVTLQGTDQVAVVDLQQHAVVRHLPTGSGPDGIAYAPASR